MEFKQIQELIRFVAKAGVSEVQLEQDDFKIVIKTGKDENSSQQQGYAQPQVYHTGNFQQQPQQQQQHGNNPMQALQHPKSEESNNAAPATASNNYETIKSPMIGTFYRKPSPDKDVYVKVGDKVSKGQVVCVIEAMKLFNEIESEISGTVVKILADDSTPVEYDQPLFLIEP